MTSEAISTIAARDEAATPTEARLLGLFEGHHRRLYRLARRLTATPDEARDLVQDTYLRVARSASSAPVGESAEEAWLVRILINVCRDQWRVRAARRRLESTYRTAGWTLARENPEAALIARTRVWRALGELAPRRRAAIVLHELEGIGISKIAQLLGISAVTVRWHLSRGRRELAQVISNQEEGNR